MALHQAIETQFSDEFTVTAAAHMSGPYSISEAMVDRILQEEPYFFPAYLVNTFLSYNYVEQLYDSAVAVFKPEYAPLADAFLAEEITLGTLNDTLVTLLETEYGASQTFRLMQDSIVAILQDPAGNADHPLWAAIRANDVYEWAPVAPTRLIYCSGDEQVAFQNALVADSVMNQLGAIDVESRNVLPGGSHGQCVFPAALFMIDFFNSFQNTTVPTEALAPEPMLTIYPNPVFTREITIAGIDHGDWQAHLFDAAGRLVDRKVLPAGERRFSVGHLPQGVYWLRLTDGRTVLTEKVFVGI